VARGRLIHLRSIVLLCFSIAYTTTNVQSGWCKPPAVKSGTYGALKVLLTEDVDVIIGPFCSPGRQQAYIHIHIRPIDTQNF